MSGKEFGAIWAIAIGVAGAVSGWAFLVQIFGMPVVPTVLLGIAVPVMCIAAAMWMVVR